MRWERSKRRLARGAVAGLSLVACAGVVILWAASYRSGASAGWHSLPDADGLFRDYTIASDWGELHFYRTFQNSDGGVHDRPRFYAYLYPAADRDAPTVWSFWGFAYEELDSGKPSDPSYNWHGWTAVDVPHWFVVLSCLLLPACFGAGYLRHRSRVRHGRCVACGYDLRGTPGRCPECGRELVGRTAGG